MVLKGLIILQLSDFLLMMRTLEHWAHRLFPKMTFDEVIERLERLGAKREVQVITGPGNLAIEKKL